MILALAGDRIVDGDDDFGRGLGEAELVPLDLAAEGSNFSARRFANGVRIPMSCSLLIGIGGAGPPLTCQVPIFASSSVNGDAPSKRTR